VDRQVLGILAPILENEIGWSEADYGLIATAFQFAYGIGLLATGRLVDIIGIKKGFSLSMTVWSIAAMAHAFAKSAFGFGAARFALGLGESANFPASIKTVAEWFPKKERALANGIFNAGTNFGAILAPLIVPWITIMWGWQEAFIFTGAIGFIWLILWFWLYESPEKQKRLSATELAYIKSDPPESKAKIPLAKIITYRQTWSFALGKFITDPIWWFYIFWIPKFLNKAYNITIDKIGLPLIIIFLMADVGSIGGGWLSSSFIKRGWDINKARKTAMLICALCVVPIIFASQATNVWMAVVFLGLATCAHQGWSTNLFTTVSDMFPNQAVGSVVGFGGLAGSISGMLFSTATGFILEFSGSYHVLFIFAGTVYLFALLVFHLLVPKINTMTEGAFKL
jgi:ACS family hexuronate transporter-like MFS transporter